MVSANRKAALVLNAFKANATRQLRQDGLWPEPFSPWVRVGVKVDLQNLGPLFNGKYYVTEVSHIFDGVKGLRSELTRLITPPIAFVP